MAYQSVIPTEFTGIICRECHEIVWSRHRHDFRHCPCGKSFVDGGRDYTRYGGELMPRLVTIKVEETT